MTQSARNDFPKNYEDGPIDIVHGRILDGQISEQTDPVTGEVSLVLEFWFKDEFLPNFEEEQKLARLSGAEADIEVHPTQAVFLSKAEYAPHVLKELDAAMVYIYAECGVDHARLIQKDGVLSVIDFDKALYTSDGALEKVAAVFEIKQYLLCDEWDVDSVMTNFALYHSAMDWQVYDAFENSFSFPFGLYDDDDDPHQPKIKIECYDGEERFHVSCHGIDGVLIEKSYDMNAQSIWTAMQDIHMIAVQFGCDSPQSYQEFVAIYESSRRQDLDAFIDEMVEKQSDNPQIRAAMQAMFDMPPGNGDVGLH